MKIFRFFNIYKKALFSAAFLLLFAGGAELTADEQSVGSVKKMLNPRTYSLKTSTKLPKLKDLQAQDIDASADSYEYVGSNLIARGHVVIRTKGMQVVGESAVINLKNYDAEVVGNVVFSVENSTVKTIGIHEYEEYLKDPAVSVKVLEVVTSGTGRRQLKVQLKSNVGYLQAERASGNLETGALQFRKFKIKSAMLYTEGELAERNPDGKIRIRSAKSSTCEYLLDSNAHYSISASSLVMWPRAVNRGLTNYNPDHGEHSILAFNTLLRVWDVPVFWFPVLFKPADTSSFGGRVEFGKSSDFGFYFRIRKDVDVLDEPALVRGALLLDFYEKRGFGVGTTFDIVTPESMTEFFAYTIRDRNPYKGWEDAFADNPKYRNGEKISDRTWAKMKNRYGVPKNRYELRLSNLTHLTPRLDFRGQLDMISDYMFLEDYFSSRFRSEPQPPTYAAFEYQGDRFSATLQTTVRANKFDAVMERLPEFRLDFPRQELFKNFYYQGQSSVGYYRMRWRDYDWDRTENPNLSISQLITAGGDPKWAKKVLRSFNDGEITKKQAARKLAYVDPMTFAGFFEDAEDYSSARFDTLHALYYPIRLFDAVNFIPRVAGRFTAYSDSTKKKISLEDYYNLVDNNSLDKWPNQNTKIRNYDDYGGARYRFAMELGAELNTKFYRTWQTPKSAFLEIDGLRHVMIPYINYTFIPKPTVSYKKLYYFDEVDQIERQNFFRFGLINRLQTRRESRIQEYFSLENYWDFHFDKSNGFNHIGDFTTIVRITPFEGLSLSSVLVLDVGGNNDHDFEVVRDGGKNVGRPGMSGNFVNRWETTLKYKFSKDWDISASYIYSDYYRQRSTYSMASTLANMNASTNFASYCDRSQLATITLGFPTYIDPRLKGRFSISYDVDEDLIDDASITLTREFHCWYLQVGGGISFERNGDGKKEWDAYIGVALGLTAMPGAALSAKYSHEYEVDEEDEEGDEITK